MGIGDVTASSFVAPFQKEAVKSFSVYDGSDRLIEFYMAPVDAADGQTCAVTYYTYVGLSNRVEKTKEALSTWQAAWDI